MLTPADVTDLLETVTRFRRIVDDQCPVGYDGPPPQGRLWRYPDYQAKRQHSERLFELMTTLRSLRKESQ